MRRCLVLLLVIMGSASAQAQTSTPTPTPDLHFYVTVIPPGQSISHDGAIALEVNAGDVGIALPLFILVVLEVLLFILGLRRGSQDEG